MEVLEGITGSGLHSVTRSLLFISITSAFDEEYCDRRIKMSRGEMHKKRGYCNFICQSMQIFATPFIEDEGAGLISWCDLTQMAKTFDELWNPLGRNAIEGQEKNGQFIISR